MKILTIFGRGDDWTEAWPNNSEIWGSSTCLLTPGLTEKAWDKVFAFDGNNFPEIGMSLDIARQRNIPIVSTLEFATELYPLRQIVAEFLSSYLRNTISYMLAMAIYQKYERIFIYGIGGRRRWDYEQGKSYIGFWLGVATGRGVDWRLGRGSARWFYSQTMETLPHLNQDEMEAWHRKCVLV